MAQIIRMPQRAQPKRSRSDSIPNQPDNVRTVDAPTQAIAEMTASADHIAGLVEQLQTCLDTVDLDVNKLNNPAEKKLLREQNQRLRVSLSAAITELHREVKKLPALHLELHANLVWEECPK